MIPIDRNKTICFSGPRPVKYEYSNMKLEKITPILHSEIMGLIQADYDTMIFGGAPGFDLISGEMALQVKKEIEYKDIKLICALPFEKFSESEHFDDYWRVKYNEIIPYCKVINVGNSSGYYRGCYSDRNFYMIDNGGTLICLHNGKPGGTGQTVSYAVKKQRRIINIYKKVETDEEY